MGKESRTDFVNRTMGLCFKSTQGKFSYCNDERKQVLFSLDCSNPDNNIILCPSWAKNGYAHSKKHINKILFEGYDLLVFKTKTKKTKQGKIVTDGFEPLLEKRVLASDSEGQYRAIPFESFISEEIYESGNSFHEGSKKTITVNSYERNTAARNSCIDALGCSCQICGFDFEAVYGDRGKGFIHVHHIVPLSEIKSDYQVDPINDLIPVCPNCHAMIHRNGHTLLPGQLKSLLHHNCQHTDSIA